MSKTIEQLQTKVAELEEENARLNLLFVKAAKGKGENLKECFSLQQQLAEKDEVIAEAGEMLAMRDRQLAALKEENTALVKTIQRDTLTSLRRLAALKVELREICAAIDDPACDLTLTTVECIKKLKEENESLKRDAEQWRAYQKRKQDLLDRGFLRSPLREEAELNPAMAQGEQK